MTNWLTSTGRIVYDPYRGNLKKKKNWWCVVEVDKEITRLYRWWVQKELMVNGMCEPSWNAHISVIRGEKPTADLMSLWKKYHGDEVTFRYKQNPQRTRDATSGGHYWVVEIDCPKLIEIRREFGYPCDWKLHLTIGRTWY